MTLDYLTNLFIKFCYSLDDADSLSSNERAAIRESIKAVVEALRDEMAINSCACKFWLDDILASDGVKSEGSE